MPASRPHHTQPRPVDFLLNARSPDLLPFHTIPSRSRAKSPPRCWDPNPVIRDPSLCQSPEVLTLTLSPWPYPLWPPNIARVPSPFDTTVTSLFLLIPLTPSLFSSARERFSRSPWGSPSLLAPYPANKTTLLAWPVHPKWTQPLPQGGPTFSPQCSSLPRPEHLLPLSLAPFPSSSHCLPLLVL